MTIDTITIAQIEYNLRDLKECRKHHCRRKDQMVWAPGRTLCSQCGSRLKDLSYRSEKCLTPIIDPLDKAITIVNAPDNARAMHFNDWPNNDDAQYLAYLESRGVKGYVKWSTWWGELNGFTRPPNHTNSWEDYGRYLVSIGIAHYSKRAIPTHSATTTTTATTAAANDEFTCTATADAPADVKGCPISIKRKIEMPNSMHQQWVYLAKRFNTEWIAYLRGIERPDGIWQIDSMYLPLQVANGAHVDAVKVSDGGTPIEAGTIGAVHSHVDMGAFFSGEDEKHMNHPIEMVVNRRGEIAASLRIQLDCGRFSRVTNKDDKKLEVWLMGESEHRALGDELDTKLKEQPSTFITASGTASGTASDTVAVGECKCTCQICRQGDHGCPSIRCRIFRLNNAYDGAN